MSNKNSKIILRLNEYSQTYINEKTNLLNHPKMVEYLFNKPIKKISHLKDLLIDYNDQIKLVRLEEKEKSKITAYFFVMLEINRYSLQHQKLMDKYPKKIKHLLQVAKPKGNKIKIMDVLNKYEGHNKICYLYDWTFLQQGEHLIITKPPTINYENPFIYDFYGVIIHHGQLVHFAIEYDNHHHFDKNYEFFDELHINDIMKQYILFQMNINLLRLNKHSDIKTEIRNFFIEIKNTSNYVIKNRISPIKKLFNIEDDNLVQFCDDYALNHIIYIKNPVEQDALYNSDDDEFFENKDVICPDDPADMGYSVSNDVLKKILKEKQDFHLVKQKKADKMVVELIGKDD